MKTLLNALFFSALAAGSPTRRDASDTSTDMDAVIAGNAECASTAVIFGRGTFDSGNIGVWVGPAFKEALLEEFGGDVHVQGVNEGDYPAELPGYVEGGSESCGYGCARTVDEYAAKCPEANIFISGWSQGGLCAWKCANRISEASRSQVKGMTTFGDENALMDNPQSLPSGLPFKPYCVQDTAAPDVLCTDSLTSGIKLPTSLSELRQLLGDKLEGLKAVATNPAQIAAALKFPAQLLSDLPKVLGSILKDIATGKVRRWLVLPQHFKYGNNGMAADAARWVADVVRGE